MTDMRLPGLLHRAVPDQGPALDADVVLRASRRRRLTRISAAVVMGLAVAAVAVPFALRSSGSAQPAGPVLPPAPVDSSLRMRALPSNALLQTFITEAHLYSPPAVPTFVHRLYQDGRLLAFQENQDHPWKVARLTADDMARVRALLHTSGLAQGGRDYAQPDSSYHGDVSGHGFQVHGAPPSVIEFGPTTNGVPPSYPGISAAQVQARTAISELSAMLYSAARAATEVLPIRQWSRYVTPSDQVAPRGVIWPAWTAGTLREGCTAIASWRTQVGTTYRPGNSPFRWDGKAWSVTYDAVLPGERACPK